MSSTDWIIEDGINSEPRLVFKFYSYSFLKSLIVQHLSTDHSIKHLKIASKLTRNSKESSSKNCQHW